MQSRENIALEPAQPCRVDLFPELVWFDFGIMTCVSISGCKVYQYIVLVSNIKFKKQVRSDFKTR